MLEEFETLLGDVQRAAKRAGDAKYLEAKREFADNLYPLLQEIVEKIDERCANTEEMILELIEQTESIVQPELATQIFGVIDLGLQLCTVVDEAKLDDVTAQKLKIIVEAYRLAATITQEAVNDATVEDDETDEDVDETGDDENEETLVDSDQKTSTIEGI